MTEPEPEEVTDKLTFVPAAMIRRLWTCPFPDCGEEYISPNALGAHRMTEHGQSE